VLDVDPHHEIGREVVGRAPIVDRAGRMLAWFEIVRAEFVGSVERKAARFPLLVTAMGLVRHRHVFLPAPRRARTPRGGGATPKSRTRPAA